MIKNPVHFAICVFFAAVAPLLRAYDGAEFKRTFTLNPSDHIVLDVAVAKGDVTILYSHAGEISIVATARSSEQKDIPQDFFDRSLAVERDGNHVRIKSKPSSSDTALRISYLVSVPDWIEVNSFVENGKQLIQGVRGPVKAVSGSGDIKATYITTSLEAKTGGGNITVIRVGSAAKVETGSGNIKLKDIGPGSTATVMKGRGRVEMDGVSGSFAASTDAGELDARGGVFGPWDLKSVSGNIRVGIAAESKFDIDAATSSGTLEIEKDDIGAPQDANPRECRRAVNGGGQLVRVRSDSGTIFIQ